MSGEHWGYFTPVNGVPILLITARGPSCINKSGLIVEYFKRSAENHQNHKPAKHTKWCHVFSLRGYASIPLSSI